MFTKALAEVVVLQMKQTYLVKLQLDSIAYLFYHNPVFKFISIPHFPPSDINAKYPSRGEALEVKMLNLDNLAFL